MTCSCIVGRTLTPKALQALDEALRTGAGTLGELARSYGLSKSPLGRHKLQCLGIEKSHEGRFREAPPPGDVPGTAAGDGDGPPRARANPPAADAKIGAGDVPGTARIDAAALGASLLHPEALGVTGFAAQVGFIADLLSSAGGWKDRRSVKALSAAWGLGHDAIHERHRAAAVLASADRGAMAEALENTIGLVTAGAEECEEQAKALEAPVVLDDGKEIPASEDARQLALKYRQLGAKNRATRMRLEGLLVSRMSISIEGDPRLAGLWPVLWAALGEVDAAAAEHRQVHERRVRSFVAAVERLTGGPLPPEVMELVTADDAGPTAAERVKEAIVRYEEQTGGRSERRLGA